jgi:hypothetical protein
MTKGAFRNLTIFDKHAHLSKHAVHIGSRDFNGYWVYLYALHNFYVEVWVLIALEQVRWIEIQENQNQIDLYLKDIDLDDLGMRSEEN